MNLVQEVEIPTDREVTYTDDEIEKIIINLPIPRLATTPAAFLSKSCCY
jgi:hypothetical protein